MGKTIRLKTKDAPGTKEIFVKEIKAIKKKKPKMKPFSKKERL